MKYFISILVYILLTLECYGQSVKYFRNYIFDERTYTLKMTFPLNLDVAKKTSCFCAKYDKTGRLTSFYLMKNGKAEEIYTGLAKIKIEYKGNTENISFFNINNKPQSISPYGHKISIQRNYKNNQIVVKLFDQDNTHSPDNNGVPTYIYTLNSRGWIVKEQYQNESGEFIAKTDSCLNIVYKWTEDKVSYTSDASYQYCKNIRLNDEDRCVRVIKTYDKQSFSPVKEESFEYERDSIDIVKKTTLLKYDSNGNIKEIKKFRSDNGLLYDYYYSSFKYNKYAYIEEIQQKQSHTFKNNKIVILRNGDYILTKTTLNSKGTNIKSISCNAKGEMIDIGDGYSVYECIYDNFGRMIEERYYDKLNNLIDANVMILKWNDASMRNDITTKKAAIIKSEYGDNKIIKKRYYNAKNELISEE